MDWLVAELEPEFATAPRDEWIERLVAADVPCSPIHDYESLSEEQQLWDNGLLQQVPHPRFGEEHVVIPTPIQLSDTPTEVQGVAPELGADQESTLAELGMGEEEVAALRAEGAFGATGQQRPKL